MTKSKIRKEIAQAIINGRSSRGWTQTDLAKKAKVTQMRISELESAKRDARLETVEKILRVLGVSLTLELKK
jgi:transcriptional regulator with XRE-family HTH domain